MASDVGLVDRDEGDIGCPVCIEDIETDELACEIGSWECVTDYRTDERE